MTTSGTPMRVIGTINDQKLLLRIYGAENSQSDVVFVSDIGVERPAETEVLRQPCPTLTLCHNQLSPRMRRRLATLPFRDIAATLPDSPVRSVRVADNDIDIPWVSADLSLNVLLPQTRDEFRDHLSFVNKRHKSPEVIKFIASQVMTSLDNDLQVDESIRGYLANTFVIYIYKLIELESKLPDGFETASLRILDIVNEIPDGLKSVREDRIHLQISCLTALWHADFHFGNFDRALHRLAEVSDLYMNCTYFSVNHGFNYCKSFLFHGTLRYVLEKDNPRDPWEDTISCYQRSVALGTRIITWFAEMGQSHQAAVCALNMSERVRTGTPLDAKTLYEQTLPAIRVDSDSFKLRLKTLIEQREARSSQQS